MNSGIFIPDNEFGIAEGYYTLNQMVELLRRHKNLPQTVQFLADMLEE